MGCYTRLFSTYLTNFKSIEWQIKLELPCGYFCPSLSFLSIKGNVLEATAMGPVFNTAANVVPPAQVSDELMTRGRATCHLPV